MISEVESLPHTELYDFYSPPEEWGCVLEFRLLYHGYLPPATRGKNRPKDKHRVRKVFHRQLAVLWKQHPLLRPQLTDRVIKFVTPENMVSEPGPGVTKIMRSTDKTAKSWVEHLADNYDKHGYRFVPLVRTESAICSVDVLLLRRDSPGGLLDSKGDIDNRIKLLIDTLKMPKDRGELGAFSLMQTRIPFFVWLKTIFQSPASA
jgi:hypothetical protein